MKKSLLRFMLAGLLIGLVFTTGCGSQSPSSQSSEGKKEAQPQAKSEVKPEAKPEKSGAKSEAMPKVLSLGTHPVGTANNSIGVGMTTVLSKALPTQVKTVPLSGPTEWLPMMLSAEIDIGLLGNWDAKMGWLGKSSYEAISNGKGFHISLLTEGHKSLQAMVTATDANIKTPADLKGKKYVIDYTGSPAITAQSESWLANYGLTRSDIIPVTVPSIAAGVKAVIERKADAVAANINMASVSELDASRGAYCLFLDMSPEAIKKSKDTFPHSPMKLTPEEFAKLSPIKQKLTKDEYIVTYPFYLVGRGDLPESVAYEIVKALWENNKELTAININLQDWTPDNFISEEFTVPFNPGAIKFYKEKGVWTEAMEKHQQELLAGKK